MISKEKILQDATEYIGIQQASGGELDGILTEVVAKLGIDVYSDEQKLTDAMIECGASETQILQVRIMTRVSGFRELIECDERTGQADIDRYVANAVQETGLNKNVILSLTAAIALSANIAFQFRATPENEQSIAEGKKAFVIPGSEYVEELESLKAEIKKSGAGTTARNRLETLVAVGVPGAKAILGQSFLQKKDDAEAVEIGLQLLREAAAEGDSTALGRLGDYYYAQEGHTGWDEAYHCYTGYGAEALTNKRQKALINILNQKKFNRKTLVTCCIVATLMLIAVILAPGMPLFAACKAFGVFCFLGSGTVAAIAILHYRVKPFGNFLWALYSVLGIWALHIAVRLIV